MWKSKRTAESSSFRFPLPFARRSKPSISQNATVSVYGRSEARKLDSEDLRIVRIDESVSEPMSVNCYRLTVGQAAKVTAEVMARQVVVHGEIAGNLCATDRIEITRGAVVTGHLTTPHIFIEDGACFKGSLQIERRKKPRQAATQTVTAA